MGRAAPEIVLSEAERAELESVARAQVRSGHGAAGADRARGGLGAREQGDLCRGRRAEQYNWQMATALRSTGGTGFTTTPGPARRARSGMRRWPKPFALGLRLCPTAQHIGLCVDEKSQIQALDPLPGRRTPSFVERGTQPLLPMRPGRAERRTHGGQSGLRPSASPRATSSVTVTQSTGSLRLAISLTGSTPICPPTWRSISSWTSTPPTRQS